MGITRLNVYAGLAGLYVIQDDNKTDAFASIDLPDLLLSEQDIPLVFMDKFFSYNDTGTVTTAPMIYPVGISDGGGGALPAFSILPETFGTWMTVNGGIYLYHNVNNDGFYLFRLLNACDSRFLRLYFETSIGNLNFTVVANDQGMFTLNPKMDEPADPFITPLYLTDGSNIPQGILADTTIENEILLGPAERYEILVTFSGLPDGENVTLKNSEITLLGPVVEGVDDQFMQFNVHASSTSTTPEPPKMWNSDSFPYDQMFQKLQSVSRPDVLNQNIMNDYINMRELWITERTQILAPYNSPSGGRPLPMLGSRYRPFGAYYEEAITEEMIQRKPTVWFLINLSNDAHVIHLHQVRFIILDRQDVGLSYQTFQNPHAPYRQYAKNPDPPGG